MYENSHSWRRRLRIQTLFVLAQKEMNSGRSFDELCPKLEYEMQLRWKLVSNTRKHYLTIIRNMLENKHAFAC